MKTTPKNSSSIKLSAGLLVWILAASAAFGQVTQFTDNFNSSNDVGWVHYAPLQPPPFNAFASWTFPPDGDGGFAYRLLGGPPQDKTGGPIRIGSFREEAAYGEFFAGVDVVDWDDTIPESVVFLSTRVTAPGFLTTHGYLAAYEQVAPGQSGSFGLVNVDLETTIYVIDQYWGGAALMPALTKDRKYRFTFGGLGTDLRAAIYERSDLLEPIVKAAARDSTQTAGYSGVGTFNFNDSRYVDWTFDNFLANSNHLSSPGFAGVPHITQITPAPNAFFFNGSTGITFRIRTLNTNQISTNSVRLVLNGTDVSAALRFTDNTIPLIDPARSDYTVRYPTALATNRIHSGKIIVNDFSGRGTTNTWTFDTFVPTNTLTIEAEDYNYDSGSFQDNPPVSGLNSSGTQVSGNGVGYYQVVGTPEVDFHDSRTSASNTNENQYRFSDHVSTYQDRRFTGDTPRPANVTADVGDYQVWQIQSDDWLNYTRTFPDRRWNVYLRASSQSEAKFRLDEVLNERNLPDQQIDLRGLFFVPQTGSSTRFRFVPLTDALGNPRAIPVGGVRTLRATALAANNNVQMNFFLFVGADAGVSLPWVASAIPAPNDQSADPQLHVELTIESADTQPAFDTVQMALDGQDISDQITVSSTVDGNGLLVTYDYPTFLPPNTTHTLRLVFGDDESPSVLQTNVWSFKTKNLQIVPATYAWPIGSGKDAGFDVQMHKARNDASDTDFPTTGDRAERQLAGLIIDPASGQPYVNEAAGTNNGRYIELNTINYEQSGQFAGYFLGDMPFPGIDPSLYGNDPNHIAMAATCYVELPAGQYHFGVRSDDGFKLTTGPTPSQTNTLLGIFDGGRPSAATEFEFLIATGGVYPLRLLWYEGIGGADVELYSADLRTGERRLVNSGVTGAIPAYRRAVYELFDAMRVGTNFSASFRTIVGRRYTVEWKNALTDSAWNQISPTIDGDGAIHTVTQSSIVATRFYRLHVQ